MIGKEEFLRQYARDLLEGSGAAFIGAGMSIPSGFVNWRDLLREIAGDLGLDVDLEHDLIAVAQYEENRKNSRDSLDRAIIRQFSQDATITDNHRLLARLPVDTVWTTNYDQLLEQAYKDARRRVDVKHAVNQLRHRNPYADVTVFKMHGDVEHPADAVLTKHDYECYEIERQAFTVQLLSDLLSKRFLFLGFSFSDPNIEYILNRLRRLLNPLRQRGSGLREHYCVLKRPMLSDYEDSDPDPQRSLELDAKRFEHKVLDLKNYGVQTVAIDSYSEVTELLNVLSRRVRTRTVMISGAVDDFSPYGETRLNELCRRLGRALIDNGFDVVTGVGKGISGSLLVGVNEALSRPDIGRIGQRLRLFPFPYWINNDDDKQAYYKANRAEMASQAGVTLVIAGNKYRGGTGVPDKSTGVFDEVELARNADQLVIPIGATGHAAKDIWSQACGDTNEWYGSLDVSAHLQTLGDENKSPEELVNAVLGMLEAFQG